MIDLDALLALRAVATWGTIARAAHERGFTASAVSQQLKRLERQVGVPLLAPAGRGIVLTPAGQALAGGAQDVLQALERSTEAARAAADGRPAGRLRVAAFSTAIRGLLAPALPTLAEHHPDLTLEITELDPDPAVQAVTHGAADVAIVHDADGLPPQLPAALAQRHLHTDVGELVMHRAHALAAADRLTSARLGGQAWVTSPPGTVCHQWFRRLLADQPTQPRIRHLVDDFATQLALVATGGLLALIPRLARPPLPADLVARPVTPPPTREITLIWRTSGARSPALRALTAALTMGCSRHA